MAALAGRKVRVKVSASGVAFTTEACTDSGDHLTYQITNTAKRVWDRSATTTVYVDGSPAAVTAYTLNRLSGKITFGSSQGASVITVSGTYLPMSLAAEAKSLSVRFTADNADASNFTSDDVVRLQLQRDVSGQLGRWQVDAYFTDAIVAGNPVVIEWFTDGAGTTPTAKCWALLDTAAIAAERKGLEEETVSWVGAADVDGRTFTFSV